MHVWARRPAGAALLLPALLFTAFLTACTEPDTGDIAERETTESATPADEPIHPRFDLSAAEIATLVDGLPEESAEAIRTRPEVFLQFFLETLEGTFATDGERPGGASAGAPGTTAAQDGSDRGYADVLRLVDKETLIGPDYVPDDIVSLQPFRNLTLNRDDLSLRTVVLPDLFAMVEAARQDGIILDLSSTYRSYTYQEGLFRYWVDELGLAEAERVSARPGTSQHQLGTTIDFGSISDEFARHPAGIWLARNGWRFGFSLSYPEGWEEVTGYKFEPWHYRWVSRPAAAMEKYFFGGVQQVMLEFFNVHYDQLTEALR